MPTQQKPERPQSFNRSRLLGRAKAREFSIVSGGWNYRNREDITMLRPHTLITGSQNVLTNVSGRVGVRKGYTLDGAADTSISSILGSYDYQMHTGTTQHLRSGFLTSAGNDGKLQFRYVSGTTVTWYTLKSNLTATNYNFCNYWDSTNLNSLCLMVNGASSITEWTGGVGLAASTTSNTIVTSGTNTIVQNGFYATGTHSLWVAGNPYVYTAISGNTFTGVTPDPTGLISAGDVVYQATETTLNSAMTSLPSTFANDLIANLNNQIYVGSLKNQTFYVSKIDAYHDYSKSTPRLPGDGMTVDLDGTPVAFVPSEDTMYISAGKDQWWQTKLTLSADLTKESFQVKRLKTAGLQGTQSQGLTAKIANHVVFLSNEPVIQTLGFDENITLVPQITDISAPIVNDINGIGSSGQIIYHKKFIYISDPSHSKVYIYNMTNPNNIYWEPPQILPIGRFSIINGDLYGHSYNSSETYKLFSGNNDNGNFIDARAQFAFSAQGTRDNTKGFNEFWLDGYISSNTTLNVTHTYDLDGCQSTEANTILGSNTRIVCIGGDDNSLGKFSLGKQPLGGNLNQVTSTSLPPYFHVILTNNKIPYFLYSPTFSSNGVDQNWEIISWGPASSSTAEGQNDITI